MRDTATEALREAIERSALAPGLERRCPYRPGQMAREIAFGARELPAGTYQSLLDLNFRRSGTTLYRPACRSCTACRQIRVRVNDFRPNRSQRRCLQANRDVSVTLSPPEPTREKHALFQSYLAQRHAKQMEGSWAGMVDFLYASPVGTIEVIYRLNDRLIGVGILDIEPSAASTVYCFFATDLASRSLGVFNVLVSLDHARRCGLEHLYLGYYIHDCRKMNYKARFRPCEILDEDGRWIGFERGERISSATPGGED